MGCGPSKILHVYKRAEVKESKALFDALCFKELDIGRLHKQFRLIDNDHSNNIELAELLAHLDLERTRFTKRIFSIFDEDNSGEIDFREFVLSLWNYCTLSRASLVMFAFDLYDKDASGSITADEVKDMLHDLYGKEFKKNPQARMVETDIAKLEAIDGDVSIEDFREFCRTHPALLFCAFQVQEAIQDRVLGMNFWAYYSTRRIEISKGRLYVPITEFMELHINKKMMKAVMTDNIGVGTKVQRFVGDEDEEIPNKKMIGRFNEKTMNVLKDTGSLSRRKSSTAEARRAEEFKKSRGKGNVKDPNSTIAEADEFQVDFERKLLELRELYKKEDGGANGNELKDQEVDTFADHKIPMKSQKSFKKSTRRTFDNAVHKSRKMSVVAVAPMNAPPTTVTEAIAMSQNLQASGAVARRGSVQVSSKRRGSVKNARRSFDSHPAMLSQIKPGSFNREPSGSKNMSTP